MSSFYSVAFYAGKTGTWFYTRFFRKHGLEHTYTAMGAYDIGPIIHRFRGEDDAVGLSVSMPFKGSVIEHLDDVDDGCKIHGICNTVVKKDGRLIGYNCDLKGALHIDGYIRDDDRVTILGNGAIGSMISRVVDYRSPSLFSPSMGNWQDRHQPSEIVINATSLGTASIDSPLETLPAGTRMVFDLAINPGKLASQCRLAGVSYVGGLTFYRYQFAMQYKLYTGISIDDEDLNDAIGEYERLFLA